MDAGQSVIINLALRELEASRLLGCLITVGYEQAALARADAVVRRTHHLIIDEFHSFTTQSAQAFSSMLSQSRKFGLYLCAAHQFWGQANQHLQDALQNTGIEVVFNVGRTDAEYTAKQLSRIDPLQVKHEVPDEYAVEKPIRSSTTWRNSGRALRSIYRIYRPGTLPSSCAAKTSKPAKPARYLHPGLIPKNWKKLSRNIYTATSGRKRKLPLSVRREDRERKPTASRK
jgi:hypothetical protein